MALRKFACLVANGVSLVFIRRFHTVNKINADSCNRLGTYSYVIEYVNGNESVRTYVRSVMGDKHGICMIW